MYQLAYVDENNTIKSVVAPTRGLLREFKTQVNPSVWRIKDQDGWMDDSPGAWMLIPEAPTEAKIIWF